MEYDTTAAEMVKIWVFEAQAATIAEEKVSLTHH